MKHFPPYKKTAVSRGNVDGKETAGKEGDKNFLPMDFRNTVPVKIGKGEEKRGSGKRFQRGKTKGKKGEEQIKPDKNRHFLPLFPLQAASA